MSRIKNIVTSGAFLVAAVLGGLAGAGNADSHKTAV